MCGSCDRTHGACVAYKLQRPSADETRLYILSSRWKDEWRGWRGARRNRVGQAPGTGSGYTTEGVIGGITLAPPPRHTMALYRELPLAAQTAFAELFELVQVT